MTWSAKHICRGPTHVQITQTRDVKMAQTEILLAFCIALQWIIINATLPPRGRLVILFIYTQFAFECL